MSKFLEKLKLVVHFISLLLINIANDNNNLIIHPSSFCQIKLEAHLSLHE
jgi:hypothetical protein